MVVDEFVERMTDDARHLQSDVQAGHSVTHVWLAIDGTHLSPFSFPQFMQTPHLHVIFLIGYYRHIS